MDSATPIGRILGYAMLVMVLASCGSQPVKEGKIKVYPQPPDEPRFYLESTLRGAGDIRHEAISTLDRIVLGVSAQETNAFNKPFDVAVHQGRVFISDSVKKQIFIADFPTGEMFTVQSGFVEKPLGLDVDGEGNLYAVDATGKKVVVFDRDGTKLRTLGRAVKFERPSGIAVTQDGSRVYVVDTGGVSSQQHTIIVLDGVSGAELFRIGKRGTEPGDFNLPREAEITKDGLLYVTDGGNFRVQVFDLDGNLISAFGSVGRNAGQFARPKGIAADPQGNIYVVDAAFGNFQIFNSDHQLLMHIGQRSGANQGGLYLLPAGIEVDEDGRVYFIDQIHQRIDIFRPAALGATEGYLRQVVPKGERPNRSQ